MKNNIIQKGLVLGIFILFFCLNFQSTGIKIEQTTRTLFYSSNILYVGGNGSGNYSKIQDAIDNASDGDTVYIYDDSSPYYENIQINTRISLIGEDKDTTVICINIKGDVITINSNNVSIHELTIKNTSGRNKAGIKIGSNFGFCTISDNIIIDNDLGIDMSFSGDYNIIKYNTFFNNKWFTIAGTNDYNLITGNTIDNPTGSNLADGISFHGSIGNNISGNTITNCDSGVSLSNDANYNIVLNNEISGNEYDGIRISECSNNQIIGNNISYNLYWGIEIQGEGNDNIIYHNNLLHNYENAIDEGNNTWDDSEFGNYWSDYEYKYPNAKKKIKEGIWDTPYEIPSEPRGNNYDNCPLLKPWPKSKSKDIPNNRKTSISPLFRFLERYPLLNHLLQRFLNL